jgi:hypothetical protein
MTRDKTMAESCAGTSGRKTLLLGLIAGSEPIRNAP